MQGCGFNGCRGRWKSAKGSNFVTAPVRNGRVVRGDLASALPRHVTGSILQTVLFLLHLVTWPTTPAILTIHLPAAATSVRYVPSLKETAPFWVRKRRL